MGVVVVVGSVALDGRGAAVDAGELCLVVVVSGRLAVAEKALGARDDAGEDLLDLGRGRRGHLEELARVAPNAVQEQRVIVEVQLQVASSAVDDHHRAPPRICDARLAAEPSVAAVDLPLRDAPQGKALVVIEGEAHPQRERQREHPVPDADVRQHAGHEIARRLRHPASEAARTEPASLARERHHAGELAPLAFVPGAATGKHATIDVALEFIAHELRQQMRGEEGGEVGAEDRVQRPLPRVEGAGVSRHAPRGSKRRYTRRARDSRRKCPARWRSGGGAAAGGREARSRSPGAWGAAPQRLAAAGRG